jgi:hypothetical protein
MLEPPNAQNCCPFLKLLCMDKSVERLNWGCANAFVKKRIPKNNIIICLLTVYK